MLHCTIGAPAASKTPTIHPLSLNQEVPMDSLQTAPGFPFAGGGRWAPFALPFIDVEALLEACRKNAAALTSANQVALEGWQSLAQRQSELLGSAVDQYGSAARDVFAAPSLAEKATR